jgi:hypothetical protein
VNHAAKKYVRDDITTNAVEGYYSIFKRGMKGVYQHYAEEHLHRYLSEFDLRYSNRVALRRAEIVIKEAANPTKHDLSRLAPPAHSLAQQEISSKEGQASIRQILANALGLSFGEACNEISSTAPLGDSKCPPD